MHPYPFFFHRHRANEPAITTPAATAAGQRRCSPSLAAIRPETWAAISCAATSSRASIAWVVAPDKKSSSVGTNVIYMRRWEFDGHPYVAPTLARVRAKLTAILNGAP